MIFALLVSLKCSMDVQAFDGRGMLLKYVTSYVTKMQDHDIINGTMLKFKKILYYVYRFFFVFFLIDSSGFEQRHNIDSFCAIFQFFINFKIFFKLHKELGFFILKLSISRKNV